MTHRVARLVSHVVGSGVGLRAASTAATTGVAGFPPGGIVVTGGGSGYARSKMWNILPNITAASIGRATCLELASRGVNVVCVDIRFVLYAYAALWAQYDRIAAAMRQQPALQQQHSQAAPRAVVRGSAAILLLLLVQAAAAP